MTTERIFEIVSGLPVMEDRRRTIGMEAYSLWLSSGFASVNDLPRANVAGASGARRELDDLAKLAFELGKHILSMHRDGLGAIEATQGNARHPLDFVDELRRLIAAVGRAEEYLDSQPDVPPRKGAPEKKQAMMVAAEAAGVYERLTGRTVAISVDPVTSRAYGPFLKFLEDVFDALKISASAEAQTRKYIKDKKRAAEGV